LKSESEEVIKHEVCSMLTTLTDIL